MVMVENYCSDPIPTVQVINEPRTVLPRAKQALSLDKGQGKHNKIYKSQRQGEEESRGMGERTTGGNGVKLSSSLSLYGNRGRTGGGRRRVSERMSGPWSESLAKKTSTDPVFGKNESWSWNPSLVLSFIPFPSKKTQ